MSQRVPDYYVIRLSRAHLGIMSDACDAFSRLRIGQLEALAGVFPGGLDYWAAQYYLGGLKAVAFPGMHANASWGVGHDKRADMAYELRKAAQYRMSWDSIPDGGMGVNFDEPMGFSGEGVPQIEADDDMISAYAELRELVSRMDDVRNAADFAKPKDRLQEYDKIAEEMGESLKRIGLARRKRKWSF